MLVTESLSYVLRGKAQGAKTLFRKHFSRISSLQDTSDYHHIDEFKFPQTKKIYETKCNVEILELIIPTLLILGAFQKHPDRFKKWFSICLISRSVKKPLIG